MNLKKVMVELDTSQVQEILRIDMDEDDGAALAFIKGKRSRVQRYRGSRFHSRPRTALGLLIYEKT